MKDVNLGIVGTSVNDELLKIQIVLLLLVETENPTIILTDGRINLKSYGNPIKEMWKPITIARSVPKPAPPPPPGSFDRSPERSQAFGSIIGRISAMGFVQMHGWEEDYEYYYRRGNVDIAFAPYFDEWDVIKLNVDPATGAWKPRVWFKHIKNRGTTAVYDPETNTYQSQASSNRAEWEVYDQASGTGDSGVRNVAKYGSFQPALNDFISRL